MAKKMKAWVFHEPEKMEFTRVAVPSIHENDLLVRVKAVGICGSDVSYYFGKSPLDTKNGKGPLILGHEISGVVEEVGDIPRDLNLFHPGDRVTLNPVQQCNSCPACLDGNFNVCRSSAVLGVSVDGGFAEFVRVRSTNALRIDDAVKFEEAALTEPLACSTNAMRKLNIRLGDSVGIIGSGSIGLMMLQIARARGAGKIIFIGTRDIPLKLGKKLGADEVINVRDKKSKYYAADVKKRISELTGGNLLDRVVVPTSAISALQQALELSGLCSTIVFFGLPGPDDKIQIPALETITSSKTIHFAWLAPLVWPETVASLGTGKVKLGKLLSHRYSLEKVEKGIRDMASGLSDKVKGV
ncbi:MAG: alcohol dehydrogenase catalytic domain-containing protein, partial [Planctomycetota bacterium]|nr:alcohol dehydrogenase catalytic domain-containing protein [Planctomycetota bacterium]